ncbi:MAG: NeuD/PglB/VioB family sugar acetyltransferase [Elusimicrobiota bacterium]
MPAKTKILIVGAGSQARYAIDILRARKGADLLGLADLESSAPLGRVINGAKVLCAAFDIAKRFKPSSCRLLLATGDNLRKKELAERFSALGFGFASAVSPQASVSPHARVGAGCILNPQAVVMTDAVVGEHVILHSHVVVEHDDMIGDFANLAPGVSLAGRVKIGMGAYLYTGAKVIPDRTVGDWAVVAAGAVVTRDVPVGGRVAGVPATAMKGKAR